MLKKAIGLWATALALLLVLGAAQTPNAPTPREQLKQYIADLQKNPSDDSLREKIIKLALTLEPKPTIPPDVDDLVGRGKYIFDHAKSEADSASFLAAAEAFGKASLLAPWVADYYNNQGVAYDKAQRYSEAVKNFQWYLLAAPDAPDGKAIHQKIGAVKYILEQQEAAASAERAHRDAELEASRAREREAQQARDRAEQEGTQRLANIDPLIRSLNGATYYFERRWGGGSYTALRYTIKSDIVDSESYNYDTDHPELNGTRRKDYPIEGQTFYLGDLGSVCQASKIGADHCGYVGTITAKGISFQFVADGKKRQAIMEGPITSYVPRK